jgi:hypothetical protein
LHLTAAALPGSFYRVGELAGIGSNIRDGEEQGNIARSAIAKTKIKRPSFEESPSSSLPLRHPAGTNYEFHK